MERGANKEYNVPASLDRPNVVSDSSGLWLYAFKGLYHAETKQPGHWAQIRNFLHEGFTSHIILPEGTLFYFNGNVTGEPGILFHQQGRWVEFLSDLNGTFSVSPDGEVNLPDYGGFYILKPGISLTEMAFVSLPGDPLPLQGVVKEKDGEYWIGSSNGVYHYRWDGTAPEGIVQAKSTHVPLNENLQVDIQKIERYIRGKSKERFQISYRIDGQAWSPFHNASRLDLPVKGLPTGEHILQVAVRNAFGKTDPHPADLHFEVQPLPLQSRIWFRPVIGISLLLILGLLWNAVVRAREISKTNQQLRGQISERKKAEESLARVNEELERRVEIRTAELSTANQSLSRQIKEREKAERALSESELRYRTLVENQGEGVGVVDNGENFVFANPAAEKIFGVPPGTLSGRNLLEFLDEENQTWLLQQTAERRRGRSSAYELEIRRLDGEKRFLLVTAVPQIDASGEVVGTFGVFRDDTERKQLEQQLLQSQKIDSVGRLAGGIAHDFNNLLTVINGHVDLVLADLSSVDPLLPSLREIKKSGERAAALTRQLLAFSRKQLLMPRIVDLNQLIRESSNLLRRLIEENIELSLCLAPDLKNVKIDPGQMEQVLMNLVINARDAMPQGGCLTLETRNMHLGDEYIRLHPAVSLGSYVLLAISDNGHGIDPVQLPHIFEPFFTTKEKGKGTGLGLAMVYGIIKQSGGFIWVYSEPKHGTCFKIYLPICGEKVETIPEETAHAYGDSPSAVVLLVEDDEMVRDLAGVTLRKHGFQVMEASGPKEALQLFEKAGASQIDLLLTDVIMPQMSGRELAHKIVQAQPGIKVLFMSGYTDTAIVQHGILEEGVNFIQKPFSPKDLVQRLREILDTRAS